MQDSIWTFATLVRIAWIFFGAILASWAIAAVFGRVARFLTAKRLSDADTQDRRIATLLHIGTRTSSGIITVVALLMALRAIAVDIAPILTGAGILGFIITFGAQSVLKDCIAGMFILIENQYNEGDMVTLDEVSGRVESLTVRKTVLRERDAIHHVPHGTVKIVTVLAAQK